jgi:hypothetical protein
MSVFVATESGSLSLSDGSVLDIYKDVTHVRDGDLALKEHGVFFRAVADVVRSGDGFETADAPPRKRAAKPKTDPPAETVED